MSKKLTNKGTKGAKSAAHLAVVENIPTELLLIKVGIISAL